MGDPQFHEAGGLSAVYGTITLVSIFHAQSDDKHTLQDIDSISIKKVSKKQSIWKVFDLFCLAFLEMSPKNNAKF